MSGNVEYRHSKTLFTDVKKNPIVFSIRPCEEKKLLRPLVEHGGGVVTSKETPTSIRLVPLTSSLRIQPSDVSTKYVTDCVKKNKLLNVEPYRLLSNESIISDISEVEEEEDGWPRTKLPTKVVLARRPRHKGWKAYTLDDEMKILKHIVQNYRHNDVKGNALWKDIETKKVLTRTWQSMREHFIKKMLPNISAYRISDNDVKKFQQLTNQNCEMSKPDNARDRNDVLYLEICSNSTTRAKFTMEDDVMILNYIISSSSRVRQIKGTNVWKDMQNRLELNRTWQSLKERFLKRILPNLSLYSVSEKYSRKMKLLKELYPSARFTTAQQGVRLQMISDSDTGDDKFAFGEKKKTALAANLRAIDSDSSDDTNIIPLKKRRNERLHLSDDEESIIELDSPPCVQANKHVYPDDDNSTKCSSDEIAGVASKNRSVSQLHVAAEPSRSCDVVPPTPRTKEASVSSKRTAFPALSEMAVSEKVSMWMQRNDTSENQLEKESPLTQTKSGSSTNVQAPVSEGEAAVEKRTSLCIVKSRSPEGLQNGKTYSRGSNSGQVQTLTCKPSDAVEADLDGSTFENLERSKVVTSTLNKERMCVGVNSASNSAGLRESTDPAVTKTIDTSMPVCVAPIAEEPSDEEAEFTQTETQESELPIVMAEHPQFHKMLASIKANLDEDDGTEGFWSCRRILCDLETKWTCETECLQEVTPELPVIVEAHAERCTAHDSLNRPPQPHGLEVVCASITSDDSLEQQLLLNLQEGELAKRMPSPALGVQLAIADARSAADTEVYHDISDEENAVNDDADFLMPCQGCSSNRKTSETDTDVVSSDKKQVSMLSKFFGTTQQKTRVLLQKWKVQELVKLIFDDS